MQIGRCLEHVFQAKNSRKLSNLRFFKTKRMGKVDDWMCKGSKMFQHEERHENSANTQYNETRKHLENTKKRKDRALSARTRLSLMFPN